MAIAISYTTKEHMREANAISVIAERFLEDNPAFSADLRIRISRAATEAKTVKEFWERVSEIK